MPGAKALPDVADARKRGLRRASLRVSAHMDNYGPEDDSWRKEEKKRTEAEIKALEKHLTDFDEKKAAQQVRNSLQTELERKRLRLREHELALQGKL